MSTLSHLSRTRNVDAESALVEKLDLPQADPHLEPQLAFALAPDGRIVARTEDCELPAVSLDAD